MALKTQNIWHLASSQPFEYQTSSVFRSPLYLNPRLVQHLEYPLWIKLKFFVKCFPESVSGFRQICSHANWQQQPNQRRILISTNKLDCFFEQKQIDGTNKTTNLNDACLQHRTDFENQSCFGSDVKIFCLFRN